MSKLCIVCGKPIAKKTQTWYLRLPIPQREETYRMIGGRQIIDQYAHPGKPAGTIERGANTVTAYVAQLPKTKEECARLTNHKIVSTRRNGNDEIEQFSAWDEESYISDFFHADICAISQGYAAAEAGYRWKFKG